MLGMLVHFLYNVTDTYWVGKLPDARFPVAAIQTVWPLIWFLASFGHGFGVAGVSLVSQYMGANRKRDAERSAGQVLVVSLLFGLAIAVAGFLLAPFLIGSMGLEEDLADSAVMYMRVVILTMPPGFVGQTFAFVLRAYGDSRTPFLVDFAGVMFNIVLDPFLIFGIGPFPAMGLLGAAVATLLAALFATALALLLIAKGKVPLRIRLSDLHPRADMLTRIFRIGLPASFASTGTALGFVVVIYILAQLPNATVALAAYGIADRAINLIFIVINGIAGAASVIIGQALGADMEGRAWEAIRKSVFLCFAILSIGSVVLYALRYPIMYAFIPGDQQVVEEGAHFLSIVLYGIPFFGVFASVTAAFQASGKTKHLMALELTRLWGIRVPLAAGLGLALAMGSTGVWVGMALSNVLSALVALGFLLSGAWKGKVI